MDYMRVWKSLPVEAQVIFSLACFANKWNPHEAMKECVVGFEVLWDFCKQLAEAHINDGLDVEALLNEISRENTEQ